MKKFKKLSKEQLKVVNGGVKWTDDRGCNVTDLRAGAKPVWIQELENWWCKL